MLRATSIVQAEEILSSLRDMKRVVVDNYGFIHQRLATDPSLVHEVISIGGGHSRAPSVRNAGFLEV